MQCCHWSADAFKVLMLLMHGCYWCTVAAALGPKLFADLSITICSSLVSVLLCQSNLSPQTEISNNQGDPPRIVFVKSLFRFFYRNFRDKIKMQQNSVNHSKFRFSTRLMQGITLLHYYQTHQGILFWPKTCHFELLNFWIRVWKQTDPPHCGYSRY